jgi:dihydroneopterin triphosphate diphosphatase
MIKPHFIAVYLVDAAMQNKPLILLLKRAKGTYFEGIWQMVTGKVDHQNESILKTAAREVFEETGLNITMLYSVDVSTFYNRHSDEVSFSANFLTFVSNDSKITLSSREHEEFKWVSFEEASILLAFPDQIKQLEMIKAYFIDKKPHKECLLKIE